MGPWEYTHNVPWFQVQCQERFGFSVLLIMRTKKKEGKKNNNGNFTKGNQLCAYIKYFGTVIWMKNDKWPNTNSTSWIWRLYDQIYSWKCIDPRFDVSWMDDWGAKATNDVIGPRTIGWHTLRNWLDYRHSSHWFPCFQAKRGFTLHAIIYTWRRVLRHLLQRI